VSMYDDLDPPYIPSSDIALTHVAARVHRLRLRRRFEFSALGSAAAVLVAVLVPLAFGGSTPHRVTVAVPNTTTTHRSSTTIAKRTRTTASTSTSTTMKPVPTTVTVPVTTRATRPPKVTTTTLPPGRIVVTLYPGQLVIPSGTTVTVSYVARNLGNGPGRLVVPACPDNQLWPDTVSRTQPVLWPVPVSPAALCAGTVRTTIQPHQWKTFQLKLVAGLLDGGAGHLVPSPPGRTSFGIANARMSVTITPPGVDPITVDHPAAVTTASNAQHWVDFTITNHLPFPVRYVDQGPCSSDIGIPCDATTPDGSVTGDMRLPPYASAKKPLYLTHFLLGANETKKARAQVHGTTTFEDIGLGSPAMPPGVYPFDWDGRKVKFTVTAAP
jgi:hypothetical protein